MEPLAALDLEALIAQDGYILGHAVLGTDRLDDTATYSWTSLVDEATSISVTRGGSSPGLVPRIDVGTLVATFVDGADPIDDPRLRPGTPLRLAARAGGELLDVYRSAFTATSADGWQHANPVWMPAGTAYNGRFWGLRWWRGLRRIVRVTETGALHLSWIDQLAEGTGLTYVVLVDGDEVARITPGTDWAARSVVVEGLRSGDVELQFQPLDPVDTRRLFIAEVVVRAEGRAPVFTGCITEVAMTEDRDGYRLMTLTAADGIASLGNTQRYGAVSTGAELWSQRIARLAKSATTPIALPSSDFDDWGAPLADVVYESTLTNHFDLACHSVGARWWVDRTNVVRFEREKIALPLAAHFSDEHASTTPPTTKTRRNLIPNPRFAVDTATWGALGGTLSAATASKMWSSMRDGRISTGYIVANGTSPYLGIQQTPASAIPVTPGQWIAVSGLIATDGDDMGARMDVVCYGSATTMHPDPTSWAIAPFYIGRRITWAFQAPATATSFVVWVRRGSGSSSVMIPAGRRLWFSDVHAATASTEAEALAQVAEFFDGDTVSTDPRMTYAWDGAPHASTSTRTEAAWAWDPLHACYTDLSLAFDVASAVNNITVTNHGRRYDPDQGSWLADDVVSIHTDAESIQRWGARSESIDLSLAEPIDVQQRAAQLLKASATPLVRPTSLTFDALHDSRTYALARSLEPYDRVTVTRSGRTYPARISGISHQVTTSSWLTTLTLREDT